MNRQYVIDLAIDASVDRGCLIYVGYDNIEESYFFTEENNLFLYQYQRFVYVVDGHDVSPY